MLEFEQNRLSGYTFIDLFAGIGGFHLALSSLGAKCVFASEINEACNRVYSSNFGIFPEGDITKIDEKDIPNHDILCAGFPCQPFSISGKQRGFNDTRGTLFFDVARIVSFKKPKIIFLENVKNFAKHDGGNTLRVVEETIINLGYHFYYKVLDASKYGVPQKRERIYMIGIRDDIFKTDFVFPDEVPLKKHVRDILEDPTLVPAKVFLKRSDYTLKEDISSPVDKCIQLGKVNKGGQGERIYSTNGVGITLSANGGGVFSKTGGYLVDGRIRKLTPRECARMMTFPDWFKIDESDHNAYTQFGNSVVVEVLQYIAESICDVLGPSGS